MSITKAHIFARFKTLLRMKGLLFVCVSMAGLILATTGIHAQVSHSATITVSNIAVVSVSSGVVSLSITGAGVVAGVNAMTVTDQSTTLSWGANTSTAKIAVKTNLVTQNIHSRSRRSISMVFHLLLELRLRRSRYPRRAQTL